MAQQALALLETWQHSAEKLGRLGNVIETRLLQALAWQAQGNLPQALTILEQALNLAQPEGYIRLFVDEGQPMAGLLALLKEQQPALHQPYLDKLLAAFTPASLPVSKLESDPAIEKSSQGEISRWGKPPGDESPPLIEPLSDRELEILRLIAAGHSNEQIAQTLIIALGTVKKHVNNIYGKLGVHSRTQALVRAKALNFL
jgi:LuxR family maltose regulon positive regulatory protein